MINITPPPGNYNTSFSVEEKKRELDHLISALSNSQRQYESNKSEKNLHGLIDKLVAIDIKLLDFINHFNLNPSQYSTANFLLIDLYSVKLFENKNMDEFQKNVCLCYNLINEHFQKLEKYNNVIFDAFSRKAAE